MVTILFLILEDDNGQIQPGIAHIQIKHTQIRLKHLYPAITPNWRSTLFLFKNRPGL